MPYECDGYPDRRFEDLDRATRAACDMRTILRKHKLESELCLETIEWIKRHDKTDAERIEKERAANERERIRNNALDKLTMDERRVLGL